MQSWSAESKAGQARRVYGLTEDGERALRTWMGVVKEERDALDRVLRRYLSSGTPDALLAEATCRVECVRRKAVTAFRNVDRDRSDAAAQLRDACRPRRHPSAASTRARGVQRFCVVAGTFRGAHRSALDGRADHLRRDRHHRVDGDHVDDGALDPGEHTRAHLEVAVARLASGNRLYDAELLRRIDARRYPVVTLDLDEVTPIGSADRYRTRRVGHDSTVPRDTCRGGRRRPAGRAARSRSAASTASTSATSTSIRRRC